MVTSKNPKNHHRLAKEPSGELGHSVPITRRRARESWKIKKSQPQKSCFDFFGIFPNSLKIKNEFKLTGSSSKKVTSHQSLGLS
jgi:hypothetical protein